MCAGSHCIRLSPPAGSMLPDSSKAVHALTSHQLSEKVNKLEGVTIVLCLFLYCVCDSWQAVAIGMCIYIPLLATLVNIDYFGLHPLYY